MCMQFKSSSPTGRDVKKGEAGNDDSASSALPPSAPLLRTLLRGVGALAALWGVAMLTGWALDLAPLKGLLSGRVTVKPNTALALVMTGVAFNLATFSNPRFMLLARAAAWMPGLIGLVTLAEYVTGWNPGFDQWLFAEPAGAVATRHPGRMAPDTAICFVLLSAALILGGSLQRSRRRGVVSAALGALVAAPALAALLVHAVSDNPTFGWWGHTMMAVETAALLTILGLALVLKGGADAGLRLESLIRPLARPDSRAGWSFLLAFLALSAAILAAGSAHYQGHVAHHQRAVQETLLAIADLKVASIQQWRREHWALAEWIRNTPYGARRALDALAQPNSQTTRQMFTAWLDPALRHGLFDRVLLVDDRLNVRLAHPPGALPALTDEERGAAERALRSRQTVVGDLHRTVEDEVQLDFVVPLVVRREGTNDNVPAAGLPASPADRSAAVLILEVDAKQFLFPLIQSWPTPSRTAETLLVRREGAEALFLNELRHRKNTALRMRMPLGTNGVLAVRGLLGETGVIEGVDYRGVPVLGAVRKVPESPWLIVSKMDLEEVNAPLRQQAAILGAVLVALLLAASLGLAFLWRRHHERLLRSQLNAERERLALARRVESLMKGAQDIILLSDAERRLVEVNDRAVETYGYTREELLQLRLDDLRAPAERPSLPAQLERLQQQVGMVFETIHQRKDGTTFPVEVSARLVELDGRPFNLGIIRDTTVRKTHEAEIRRLTRLYATLSQVNQTIVRCQSRQELFADICRVAVEFGEFKAAWIGWRDSAEQPLATAATRVADAETGLNMPGWIEGCGVVAEALRTGQPCLCHEAQADARAACCREVMRRLGVQSCAAFPLWLGGQALGVLAICSLERSFLNPEEARLLEEVSSDVTFALDRLDKEARRQQAEAALRKHAEDLRARNEELERWHRATVGRELRMIELKQQVNELCRRLGEPPPYEPAGANGATGSRTGKDKP